MSRATYISAGSNTAVAAAPGTLYGIHVSGGNGATVYVQDSLTGLGATPNFNATSVTGLIARLGPVQNVGPHTFNFHGVHFDNGLVVAASSSPQVTVYWSQ